ncbi:NAD-binding protein [Mycena olivaceomarginata]|nr:NAD-binding protein [Mycena olivaceomarginata]
MPTSLSLIGLAQGIGRAIALRLAEDGFDVAVNDVSSKSENLDTLVEEIQKKGRASSKHIADVSQDQQVQTLVEEVVKKHGSLDVVLPFIEVTAEDWDQVLAVNARGPFLCYKYAGIQMIKQGHGGRIIGISSLAGKQGSLLTAYSASKFAVRGLTQAAAAELGAHQITVNAVAPGVIDTPIPRNLPAFSVEGSTLLEQVTAIDPAITLPEDIASLVSFLASKESQFITGQTISSNGGLFFD